MDTLHCPIFHDTDGRCCPPGDTCLFAKTPVIRLDAQAQIAAEHTALLRAVLTGVIVCVLAIATVLGAVALERQDRAIKADMQEQVVPK